MTTYQQYQANFAQSLKNSVKNSNVEAKDKSLPDKVINELVALIDTLPYYGNPDWKTAHRAPLINFFEYYLPDKSVAAPPPDKGFGYVTTYEYQGKYKKYKDVFYGSISLISMALSLKQWFGTTNPQFVTENWNKYAVALLTDAIRNTPKVDVDINNSKVTTDLSNYNNLLMPSLSASFLVVFESGYSPTSNALNAIIAANDLAAACTALNKAILEGEFTANINQALSIGGDSATAATWFLFNLWITLTALGCSDVNAAIKSYMTAGLQVPSQVSPTKWWTGSYTSWYAYLSGSDIKANNITAGMPVESVTCYSMSPWPDSSSYDIPNGYSISFCEDGDLSYYN